ncbi:MAG: ABC transporter ATP-binding protein [Calditrichia bacterium]
MMIEEQQIQLKAADHANPEPIIRVEELSKYYGRKRGVESLTFSVMPGEIFGFLGPNGAGKTTTIRLLLDLIHPTAGRIFLFGKPLKDHSVEIRRKCGYLPGEFAAYTHLTMNEFLHFVAGLRGSESRLPADLFKRFNLSAEEQARKIKHLSHGTRQKLGIIQAFFGNPELLILDEPTSGLDPLMQEELYELIRQKQRQGCTIFFSSHNLAEVEKICHRVAIVREGRLVALETLESLKQKRFRRLQLTLKSPVEKVNPPEAKLVNQKGLKYEFLVKGDIKRLLVYLSRLPVENIVFPEPNLEEVFMTYYRDGHQ